MEGAILARQAAAKSSAEEFLELIQNPFSAAVRSILFRIQIPETICLKLTFALCL